MPRQPRYFISNIPQHVIQRGVDRQPVFFAPEDYRLYLGVLGEAAAKFDCRIHAYVLMTNHTHLLVTPASERSLPLIMQAVGRSYVQKINRKYGRTGTLWEGRYKASLVQDDRYLLTCLRYIELNPVRAGMVNSPGDYRYSSFARNAHGRADSIVTPHETYQALARKPVERQAVYREMFGEDLAAETLATIRETTNACRVLGDERFKDQMEALLGRSVRPGRNGRPPAIDH